MAVRREPRGPLRGGEGPHAARRARRGAERKGDARVVVVSSVGHFFPAAGGVGLSLDAINDAARYREDVAYGQSKLANVLFARELQRRMDEKAAQVFVGIVHPGAVRGDLFRHLRERIAGVFGNATARFVESTMLTAYWTEQEGALTALFPATSPEVAKKGMRGQYYVPIARPSEPSALAKNETLGRQLWAFTEQLLKDRGL